MDWLKSALAAGALAAFLAPGAARAADDTGRVCAVNATSGKPGEGLSLAAVTRAVQAAHCAPGDALELTYAEANPAPVVAQFCDLARQIYAYNAPSSFAQVGITSELVCSLATRRTGR